MSDTCVCKEKKRIKELEEENIRLKTDVSNLGAGLSKAEEINIFLGEREKKARAELVEYKATAKILAHQALAYSSVADKVPLCNAMVEGMAEGLINRALSKAREGRSK